MGNRNITNNKLAGLRLQINQQSKQLVEFANQSTDIAKFNLMFDDIQKLKAQADELEYQHEQCS